MLRTRPTNHRPEPGGRHLTRRTWSPGDDPTVCARSLGRSMGSSAGTFRTCLTPTLSSHRPMSDEPLAFPTNSPSSVGAIHVPTAVPITVAVADSDTADEPDGNPGHPPSSGLRRRTWPPSSAAWVRKDSAASWDCLNDRSPLPMRRRRRSRPVPDRDLGGKRNVEPGRLRLPRTSRDIGGDAAHAGTRCGHHPHQ